MIEEYKELVLAKQNLRQKQESWLKMLENEFPALTNKDINSFEEKIGDELEFFLSSALKTKSGRILIPISNSWKKFVVLTRNPGLKHPYESIRRVRMSDLIRVNSNRSLLFDRNTVSLQILENDSQIDQDKLRKFYELARKFADFKSQIRNLIINSEYLYDHNDKDQPVFASLPLKDLGDKTLKVFLGSSKFIISVPSKSSFYTLDSKNFEEYPVPIRSWENPPLSLQIDLISVLPQLETILRDAEKKKLKLVNALESFLNELKQVNKKFRVLIKLTK